MKRMILIAFALLTSCYDPNYGMVGFYCHPTDNPACPQGQSCQMVGGDFRCVAGGPGTGSGGSALIPKTGAPYSGPHTDPGLNNESDCPDYDPNPLLSLEPSDTPPTAIDVTGPGGDPPLPDMPTPKITHMAICPKGPNPAANTGMHDVDYYKIDTTAPSLAGSNISTMMAEIFYDVSYGDLDVGIFDSTGRMLAGDGSSVTNGCVAASIASPGVYYVVVDGANNMDVNRYDIRIRTFSSSHSCPSGTPDMGQ